MDYTPRVGDQLYVSGRNRNRSYEAIVVSVGRKWAYLIPTDQYHNMLQRDGKFDFQTQKSRCRRFSLDRDQFEIDGNGYASPGTVYLSKEHFDRSVTRDKLWGQFRDKVAIRFKAPPEEDILKAAKVLGIDLDIE